jgi:MATE family multidrug resistance protein
MTATLHPTSRLTVSEHGAMLRLAWPLIAGNLAQIMLTTTDVLLIGRLGGISLASGALAASFYQAVSVFCAGLVMATTPLIAAALGRGSDPADLRAIIANGFLSGLLIGVPTSSSRSARHRRWPRARVR